MAKTLIMTVILLTSVASVVQTTATPPTITATSQMATTETSTTAVPTTTTAVPTTTTAVAPTTTTAVPTTTTAVPTTTTAAAPMTTRSAAPTTTAATMTTPSAAPTSPAAPTTTAAPMTTRSAAPTTTAATMTTPSAAPTSPAAPTTTAAAATTTTAAPMTTRSAAPTTTAATMTTPSAAPTSPAAPTTTETPTMTNPAAPMTTTVAGGQTTTTEPISVCASSPCLCGSTCEERANQTYVCLCLAGEAQGPQGCQKAKVFPGLLDWKKNYDPEMSDKTSQIFKETSDKITDLIDKEFENKTGYISSLVLELREARRERGSVEASLQIIFETTSDSTEETVTKTMEMVACGNCPLQGSFTAKNLCDFDPCDNSSTTCDPTDGNFTCSCANGYINTDYSDRLCIVCPPGQKAVNNKCIKCDFGRTGLNCEDERLLIVVIVSSVLGFLLVVALIALLIVVKKFKRIKFFRSKQEDIRRPFQLTSLGKGPLSSNGNGYYISLKEPVSSPENSGVPEIPQANTINNCDNLEMTQRNNEPNPPFDDNHVDMVSFSQS